MIEIIDRGLCAACIQRGVGKGEYMAERPDVDHHLIPGTHLDAKVSVGNKATMETVT